MIMQPVQCTVTMMMKKWLKGKVQTSWVQLKQKAGGAYANGKKFSFTAAAACKP